MAGPTHSSPWQRLWLPAFAFMSVVVGGGYATGREVVEFFMTAGPLAGLAGLAVTAASWSLIAALSFDFAREAAAFDYRSFFQRLLGRGWILFDLCYLGILLLVLCVVGAAAGEIAANLLGLPRWWGAVALLGLVDDRARILGPLQSSAFSASGASSWWLLTPCCWAPPYGYSTTPSRLRWFRHRGITWWLTVGCSTRATTSRWAGDSLLRATSTEPARFLGRGFAVRSDRSPAGTVPLRRPAGCLPGGARCSSAAAGSPAASRRAVAGSADAGRHLWHTGPETGVGVLQGFVERLMPGSTIAPRRDAAIRPR